MQNMSDMPFTAFARSLFKMHVNSMIKHAHFEIIRKDMQSGDFTRGSLVHSQ